MKHFRSLLGFSFLAILSACGTTFQLPDLGEAESLAATRMFAEARAEGARRPNSPAVAEQRFRRVAGRISGTGKKYCEVVTAEQKNFNCNVDVGIDHNTTERNAYFTYHQGRPLIRITMPMLQDSASDDEVAFILSHEYGHLIGHHIEKQKQQEVAGALILGTIAAAAGSYSAANGGYYSQSAVGDSMELGAALGGRAYSQSYELESDILGTRIAASAGYDPVKGARFFARSEAAKTASGKLSFWGTHPPDEKRLATVLATKAEIDAKVGLRRAQKTTN